VVRQREKWGVSGFRAHLAGRSEQSETSSSFTN
jgi:hypothetical protein